MAIEVFTYVVGETDLEKIEDLRVVLLVDGHRSMVIGVAPPGGMGYFACAAPAARVRIGRAAAGILAAVT
jgi:hypothetical protein